MDDINSLDEFETSLANRIQFMLDAAAGFIGVANDVVKVLTVVSVAGVPPVLIVGVYGMNFQYMPELAWPWGYPFAMALVVLSTIIPVLRSSNGATGCDGSGAVTRATFEVQAEDAAEAVAGAAPVTHMADDAGHPLGLAPPRLYWSVLAIWLAMGMSVIDQSIADIALPTIAREVGATPAASIWVLNANQIAVAMTLLPAAALGDIFGCRRMYLIGLCIFIAASIGCTFATSLTTLTIARFFSGFGAASIMGINAALVRYTYPPDRLGRGLGYNTLVIALTSASGPTIASAILSVAPWPALFAVNVPFGIAALIVGSRALPLTPRSHRRFDYVAVLHFAQLDRAIPS